MAEDLLEKYAKLQISEEENSIIELGSDIPVTIDDKVFLMLVGRLVTNRNYNLEEFKRTITQAWGVHKKVVIKSIETNLFVFHFFHWHWCFDQHFLMLNEITWNEQPSQVLLSYSPFWVRIYNISFNCRINEDVKTICVSIGTLMDIENDELGLEKY